MVSVTERVKTLFSSYLQPRSAGGGLGGRNLDLRSVHSVASMTLDTSGCHMQVLLAELLNQGPLLWSGASPSVPPSAGCRALAFSYFRMSRSVFLMGVSIIAVGMNTSP